MNLAGVVGLSAEKLTGVAYDDETQWPESVDEADLDMPSDYSEPRLCVAEHLKGEEATAVTSPQPGAALTSPQPEAVPTS